MKNLKTSPIIISLSGGKDSVAMLLHLVEHYGAARLIAHIQVMAEDWPQTLTYTREVCARLGVRLVAQQMLYEPICGPDSTRVQRLEVRDIHTERDIVRFGTGMIAGCIDLAYRRRWPPSPAARFGTSYFKVRLLNWWIAQQQRSDLALGQDVVVALGERAGESRRRAKKVELWPRPKCQRRAYRVWNWLPVLSCSRRDVFRKLRDYGLRPHPGYQIQGLTTRQMLDEDREGGPRIGCRFCINATERDICHQANEECNRGLLWYIAGFEQATGRTWWARKRKTATRYVTERWENWLEQIAVPMVPNIRGEKQ